MSYLTIRGGKPLRGELDLQGAKNAVLPILAATILCGEPCRILHCPHLSDVEAACDILRYLGCQAQWRGDDLWIDTASMTRCDIPESMMHRMRSSVIFLGAILARCGECALFYPGGCELGPRPIDLHVAALRTLGAHIDEQGGTLYCTAEKLRGSEIVLSLPSVGATENAMLAACGAEGTTVISNAAREPEIVDLQNFLNACGAHVSGAGGSTIAVTAPKALHGCTHRCIGDRIVAATYLSAAAATAGEITLNHIDATHLATVTTVLRQAGCHIHASADTLTLSAPERLRSVAPIRTSPYPGFPTDAQAVVMAALLRSQGTTVFVENMFESRYRHVPELCRMGADIKLEGRVAVVCGVEALHGADVHSTDLRGGAALAVAALHTQETTRVHAYHHICRGYEDIARDLTLLGAYISLT